MNLEQATRWRNVIGKACALFGALFMLAALDGIVAHFRQPENLVELLPGESTDINGTLLGSIDGIHELNYASSSDLAQVSFEAVHTGFWVGGQMWRGKLSVSPQIPAGEYTITVNRKDAAGKKPSSIFHVKVYSDHEGFRRSSLSFARRFFDLSPWWLFSVSLPAALLALGAVYLVSHKRDEFLALEGKAEIYHIVQGSNEYEVAFGLGSKHGLRAGDRLVVLDGYGNHVGSLEVRDVGKADSTGVAGLDCPVKPGYTVLRA